MAKRHADSDVLDLRTQRCVACGKIAPGDLGGGHVTTYDRVSITASWCGQGCVKKARAKQPSCKCGDLSCYGPWSPEKHGVIAEAYR